MTSGPAHEGRSGFRLARRRALQASVALAALGAVLALDVRWGARLPVELLYVPCLFALGWHADRGAVLALAAIVAVFPVALQGFTAGSVRELAPVTVALRTVVFLGVVSAGLMARGRWHRLLDRTHEDSLTGLLHHGAFAEVVARELRRQQRDHSDVSLLSLDVDGFKRLNDTHGHAYGDGVLVALAAELRSNVRASDVVGRTGGDEFAVLLPDAPASAAVVVREHLRAVLTSWAARARLPIGFSLGVATSEAGRPLDGATLRERADRDMYREKKRHHAASGLLDMRAVRRHP